MSTMNHTAELQKAEGRGKLLTSIFRQDADTLGTNAMSIALIGPEEQRRKAVAAALAGPQVNVTREFTSYPGLDDVPRLLEEEYDVIIIDLDSNPEHTLDLVEGICSNHSATVMVYSTRSDSEMLVRCMRAGTREYLTYPIAPSTIAEAIVRASVRRPASRSSKKTESKLQLFVGGKGGAGITTVASNFAVALAEQARDSKQNVLFIDLNLPLGDSAIHFGVAAQYSTVNALQNLERLDSNFLSNLLVKHTSGLAVLPAPDKYTEIEAPDYAVEKLLAVARQEFDHVVVDLGSRLDSKAKALFQDATTIYLVTQVSVPDLHNCNRLIAEFFRSSSSKLEIVLNRFAPRSLGFDEESITKALTMPAQWKIPNDYPAVRLAQNTGTPLVLKDSPISRVIRQMARTANGASVTPEKKKLFSLFG
jgi:pilus assembly protein CpaE